MMPAYLVDFTVRVVVEADDHAGAIAAVQTGIEDLNAAHELDDGSDGCPEAALVAQALCDLAADDENFSAVEGTF